MDERRPRKSKTKPQTEEYESPLKRFIRLHCSHCPHWVNFCDLASDNGLVRMSMCLSYLEIMVLAGFTEHGEGDVTVKV